MARPVKKLSDVVAKTTPVEGKPTAAPVRPKRPPLTGRNVLTVQGQEAGWSYRLVNDEGDRIEIFKERGWEVVSNSDVRIGDRRVAVPKSEGTPATAHVGSGLKAVVMRLPDELYIEDQRLKQEEVDALESSLKRAGDYGRLDIKNK